MLTQPILYQLYHEHLDAGRDFRLFIWLSWDEDDETGSVVISHMGGPHGRWEFFREVADPDYIRDTIHLAADCKEV